MRILDKNKDFYDYLSHTQIADDSVLFDRRDSIKLTKSQFLEGIQTHAIQRYEIDSEIRGKTWKHYKHRQENPFFTIGILAGTNLFIVNLTSLVFEEKTDENGKIVKNLCDFSPKLVCTRKFYSHKLCALSIFDLEESWYDWRRRVFVNAKDSEKTWQDANLSLVRFRPIFGKKIPILCETKLPAIIRAEDVYRGIEEYLFSQKEECVQESKNLSDAQKAVNHGFDAKTSFRKM